MGGGGGACLANALGVCSSRAGRGRHPVCLSLVGGRSRIGGRIVSVSPGPFSRRFYLCLGLSGADGIFVSVRSARKGLGCGCGTKVLSEKGRVAALRPGLGGNVCVVGVCVGKGGRRLSVVSGWAAS